MDMRPSRRVQLVTAVLLVIWLLPGAASAARGDLRLLLEPGYSYDLADDWQRHGAGLGAALELGVNSRAGLRLATRWDQGLIAEGEAQPPWALGPSVALDLGATVLVDALPGLAPRIFIDLLGSYGSQPGARVLDGLRVGASTGLGLDFLIGDHLLLGGVARYAMLGSLAEIGGAMPLQSRLSLELRVGFRLDRD